MNKQDFKIIISRTDNLGDVVLTLPIAGYLKSIYPHSIVYFIGKKYTQPLIEGCSYVDFFLDRDDVIKNPGSLKTVHADIIIFIFPDKDLAQISKKVKIPIRIGTSHRWFHWIYCNKLVGFSRKKSDLHESQLNFKLLKPLGISTEIGLNQIIGFYGLKNSPFGISDIAIDPQKINLIIHPKSKGSAKEWGLDNYFNLINSLDDQKFKIFITGVQQEGDDIFNEKPELLAHPQVVNLTGKLSLQQMITFIGQVDALLACSTGVLHISAALGKFSLGIFSPMRPIHPARWQPLGKNASYLVLDKECNDCRKKPDCACIKAITVAEVKKQLEEFAQKKSSFNLD